MSFEEIIDQVKNYPTLWDRSLPTYKDRSIADEIWNIISNELGVDVKTLRKRWRHLKDHFRKQYKKILASDQPNPDLVESCWKHFKPMNFLIKGFYSHLKPPDKTNIVRPPDSPTCVESDSDWESDDDNVLVTLTSTQSRKTDDKVVPTTSRSVNQPQKPSLRNESSRNLNQSQHPTMQNKTSSNLNQPQHTSLQNLDPDYMFLRSLLPSLKNLTEIQKLQFRGKVNDWLLQTYTQNEWKPAAGSQIYLQTTYPKQEDEVDSKEHIVLEPMEDVKPSIVMD